MIQLDKQKVKLIKFKIDTNANQITFFISQI